jgi:hypothetical protein
MIAAGTATPAATSPSLTVWSRIEATTMTTSTEFTAAISSAMNGSLTTLNGMEADDDDFDGIYSLIVWDDDNSNPDADFSTFGDVSLIDFSEDSASDDDEEEESASIAMDVSTLVHGTIASSTLATWRTGKLIC